MKDTTRGHGHYHVTEPLDDGADLDWAFHKPDAEAIQAAHPDSIIVYCAPGNGCTVEGEPLVPHNHNRENEHE